MLATPNAVPLSEIVDIFDNLEVSESLSTLYAQVTRSSCLTLDDRSLIKSVLTQNYLNEEDCRIINRILYSVRRGWIRLEESLNPSLSSYRAKSGLRILESVA